jgi:hypothetical protein
LFFKCVQLENIVLAVLRFAASMSARKRSKRGCTSCGPGLASGCPWKLNAGCRAMAMPCSVPSNVRATHRSLFDGSLQGIACTDRPAFGFQGHPEASPGPRDLAPLFSRFVESMLRKGAMPVRQPA